jgi:hypothetical protein
VALSAWLFAIALILLRFAANMAARALDPRPSSEQAG